MAGIVLTNDGNAILIELDVSHPAAKVSPEEPGDYTVHYHGVTSILLFQDVGVAI